MTANHLLSRVWLRWSGALALCLAAVAAGCGGSVGVGGTGSYSSAPIEGFGSVYVGGIKYDDSNAAVFDEDGAMIARDALRLGMVVEVDGGEIGGTDAAPVAQATRIRTVAEVVGTASSVDAAAGTLKVFEQNVLVDAFTIFDAALPDGLASVANGAALEVSGHYDAAATRFVATRISPRAGTLAEYRVRGPVQGLDTTAKTFRIGAAGFAYDGAQPLLADGAYLRVRAGTVPAGGRWTVTALSAGVRVLPDLDRVKLRGTITRYLSDTDFDLNGQAVDARNANFTGRPGDLALGKAVVVDGRSAGGVLIASKVRLDDHGGSQGNVTLQGAIGSLDTAAKTFVVRGSTVFYGANGLQYEGGTETDLANGRAVTVRAGSTGNSAVLTARRISFN
jgi:hypothetical protein